MLTICTIQYVYTHYNIPHDSIVRLCVCMCVCMCACVNLCVCVGLCEEKKRKKEDPRSLGLFRELTLTLRILRRLVVWETSCETQSSPHTVLCTGVLQLTTEGQDFFSEIYPKNPSDEGIEPITLALHVTIASR